MKRLLLFMLIIVFLFGVDTEAKKTKRDSKFVKFEKVWLKFQAAAVTGDKETLFSFFNLGEEYSTYYDVTGEMVNRMPIIKNLTDFLKNYHTIFTPKILKTISEIKANEFSYGDEDGYDWYRFFKKIDDKSIFFYFVDMGSGYKLVYCSGWN